MTSLISSQPPQLSKKEIEDLLKKGAYGSLMEDDDAANQSVDNVLCALFINSSSSCVCVMVGSVRRI